MRLLVATKNKGKAAEFAEMLRPLGFEVEHLAHRPPDHDDIATVDETGRSFIENASLKATGYAKATGLWSLADDSGLMVDALGGLPGVDSANFAELNHAGKGDAANNALLLERMSDVADSDRSARFVCVLALANPQGRVLVTTRGQVEGRIVRVARGSGGFGYDPLFEVERSGKTTAELSKQEKHAVSHRGRAIRELARLLDLHRSIFHREFNAGL